jgi:hypothetical protein
MSLDHEEERAFSPGNEQMADDPSVPAKLKLPVLSNTTPEMESRCETIKGCRKSPTKPRQYQAVKKK